MNFQHRGKRLPLFTLFLFFLASLTAGHDNYPPVLPDRDRVLPGAAEVRYTENNLFPQYIRFDRKILVRPEEGIMWLKKHLELPADSDFTLIRTDEDNLGYTHARYQHTVHGIPVIGSVYIVHSRDGRVEMMNGELYNPASEHPPSINVQEDIAIAVAMQHFPSSVYGWEVSLPGHTETRSEYPAPELVYVPEHLDFTLPRFRPAFKMDIYALSPLKRAWIYVDAESGIIIAEENRICHIDEEGTAHTNFSGTQTVITDNTGAGYQSRETGRGIETFSDAGNLFTDADNVWEPTAGAPSEYAMDAHFGAEVYHDMLEEDYDRNSMDDAGHLLTSNIYFNAGFNNAFWDGATATFGDGDGFTFTHFASPEIVGHEFQHGTTEFSAGLIYNSESGALNESFSDIFGHMTDIRARGDEALYIVGEQTVISGEGIRSMSDPNIHGSPDTYGGDLWDDFNGVHTNSGVQNHWFHILSEGETDVNDLGNAYSVTGIGTAAAAQVAMRNLLYYLTPSSDYADAGFYARQAAVDIFGGCATEVAEVVNAWYAVGVGVEVSTDFGIDFAAQTTQCDLPAVVEFQNLSTLAAEAVWDFGDGNTSTEYTPVHTYTSAGVYDVKLTVTGCEGETDSLTKFAYINIDPEAPFCDTVIMETSGVHTLTDCSGTILDPGGTANYPNGVNTTYIIEPATASTISLFFAEFATESGWDYLYLYDGNGTSSPALGVYDGGSLAGQTVESTGGAITIQFTSDGSVTNPGFVINYSVEGGSVPPTAGFDISDDNPPLNAPVSFTNTATAGGSYTYEFGDGNFAYEASPTHYYTEPGTYTVTQIISNCVGSDTLSQVLTVQPPGAMTIDPESLCVTLLAGETSVETVNVTNTGAGDLYYEFSEPVAEEMFSNTEFYSTFGALTEHNFADISPTTGELVITVLINGDFDDFDETATVSVEGTEVGVLGTDFVPNGTDIVATFTYTDPTVISDFLADGNLYIAVQNSVITDTGQGGTDSHTVNVTADGSTFFDISPDSGIVPAGGSGSFDVHFNTAGLFGGTYTFDVPLLTSDPTQTDIAYPVKLIVIGQPLIEIDPAALDMGDVFIGYPETDSLCINNPGTDTLYVTGIASSNPVFTATENTLTVAPFGSVKLPVTFNPVTAGVFSGTFTFESNAGQVVVPVTGNALDAPVAVLDPDSICITVPAGEIGLQTVTISNTGNSQLEWEIDADNTGSTIEILAWLHGVDLDEEWVNTQEALSSTFSNYNLAEINTTSPSQLEAALEDKHILLMPEAEDGDFSVFASAGDIITDFVENGGAVIFLMEASGLAPAATGIFPYTESTNLNGSTLDIEMPEHPLLEGVVPPLTGVNATRGCIFTVPTTTFVSGFTDYSVFAEREIGAGKAIYLGYDYFAYGANEAIMLGNAVEYAAVLGLPDWLTPDPTSGTVAGQSSEEFTLTFDATELLGGTYNHTVTINTNEPTETPLELPVKLIVVGQPVLEVTPDALDFGEVFIDFTGTDSLCLSNPGTDTLFVTDISSDNAVFSVEETVFALPPFGTVKTAVFFNPEAEGDFTGTLTIESNVDPQTVPVSGVGAEAPVATVTPDDICITLMEGETASEIVTLSNIGGADLDWEISATSSGGTVEILAWLHGVDLDEEWINTQAALNSTFTDYNLTETLTTDPAELADLLTDAHLLLLPESEGGFTTTFAAAADVLQNYVSSGGSVLFLMDSSGNPTAQTGLMPHEFTSNLNGNTLTVLQPEHPILENVTVPVVGVNATRGLQFTDAEPILVGLPDYAVIAEKEIGSGRVVYLGYDYFAYGDNEAQMLGNAVQYTAVQILPEWLTPSPTDGTVAPGASQEITLDFDATGLTAGTYEYNLAINTNEPTGAPVMVSVKMIVTAAPTAQFTADNTENCDGIVNFTDETLNAPTSWFWQFGDGNISSQQNPTHVYDASGSYDVTLEACNDIGCETLTLPNYITVNLDGDFCDTLITEINGNAVLSSCTGLIYDNGGPDENYDNNVDYTVFLTPEGAAGVTITFLEFETESCCDFLTVFDGPTTASPIIGSYSGSVLPNGGTISSTGDALTLRFDTDGSVVRPGFKIEYQCTGTAPTASFQSLTDGDCLNTIQFINGSQGGDSYLWNFGDGTTSTEFSPVHNYAAAGDYNVILTVTNTFGEDITAQSISVTEMPFELEINAPETISSNSVSNFSYNASTDLTGVVWDLGPGGTTTIDNPSFIYLQTGEVTVSLTGTDADGCEVTVYHTLNVVTDTENPALLSAFNVYPNPSAGEVTVAVDLPFQANTELTVYNTLGQLLLQEARSDVRSYRAGLDLQHLPAGQYFVLLAVNGEPAGREILVIE